MGKGKSRGQKNEGLHGPDCPKVWTVLQTDSGRQIPVHCAHDELVEIGRLVPNPSNPNQHPQKQLVLLAQMIDARGWRAPITVSNRSGFVVRGHARLAAGRLLGCAQVPVDYQDYANEAEEWADLVGDNKIAELAETDDVLLRKMLEGIQAGGIDLSLTGVDIQALEAAIASGVANNPDVGPTQPMPSLQDFSGIDELKPTNEEHEILKGRRFICEFSGGKDSTLAAVWVKRFYPDNLCDLIFCDAGADFIGFHFHLERVAEWINAPLTILRTKYNMIDMILRKGKWPYAIAPYCQQMIFERMDDNLQAFNANDIVIIRGGNMGQRNKQRKTRRVSRFMAVERIKQFKFFQPIYYVKSTSTRALCDAACVPMWEGYKYGLQRTACRICPGQNQVGYAAIRLNYPDVWDELIEMEQRLGPGAWNDPIDNAFHGNFTELANRGETRLLQGGYPIRRSVAQ